MIRNAPKECALLGHSKCTHLDYFLSPFIFLFQFFFFRKKINKIMIKLAQHLFSYFQCRLVVVQNCVCLNQQHNSNKSVLWCYKYKPFSFIFCCLNHPESPKCIQSLHRIDPLRRMSSNNCIVAFRQTRRATE